jgi:hypothetical protein
VLFRNSDSFAFTYNLKGCSKINDPINKDSWDAIEIEIKDNN